MGREPADRADLAADRPDLAVELDRLGAGLEVGPEGPLALVADEQDRRVRVVDEVAQVADDAAAGEHAVGRDDHVRPRRPGDRLRCLHVVRHDLVRVVERGRRPSRSSSRGLLVVVVGVAPVDVGGLRGHRRVEVERQQRDLAALDEPVELPDDLLGPPDGERRHEQHALGLGDQPDRLGQERMASSSARVRGRRRSTRRARSPRRSAAVGSRRIGVPGPAQVAGEDDGPLLAAVGLLDAQPMIAEPRMWPASRNVGVDARARPRAPRRRRSAWKCAERPLARP